MTGNYGNVSGKDHVGGIAGENNQALTDVTVVNEGNVAASDGGAGGVFGVNNKDITDSHMTSKGSVTGTAGDGTSGTGGIFGINTGNVTGSVLENTTGTITGESNTGGIFGINSGNISTSSLKNEANITVTAKDGQTVSDIGGLIGKNTGTITGGRDDNGNDAGYYKNQIYNNGTITVNVNGTNIGGLLGSNAKTGSLTAGYNTGAIIAGGSSNVGGIAGTNEGTLDQVFNTVITGVDEKGETKYGSITGAANVGGLVGTNEADATISNAYNTTGVSEGAGTIAGNNAGTIKNVYSSVTGNLTNEGSTGTVTNGYDITQSETGKDWQTDEAYGGFDFDDTWKIYEGSTNPLLKVFLTQLTVNDTAEINGETVSLNDFLDLVYNGREQDIDIADLIDKGFITGPEGMTYTDEEGNKHSFADAFQNTLHPEDNPYHDSELLYNTDGQQNAGKYDNWLASAQIAAGHDGNPNNLGYDIDASKLTGDNQITIDKAVIKVEGSTVDRTYGDTTITDGSYGYQLSGDNFGEFTDEMKQELTGDSLGFDTSKVSDNALTVNDSGRVTNEVRDDYAWSADLTLSDALKGNYTFEGGTDEGTTVTVVGGSRVNRANITIGANDVTIYEGETPHYTGTNINDVLENGDTILNGDYFYAPENPDDRTNGAAIGIHLGGSYLTDTSEQSAWDAVMNGLFKNYTVNFKPGTLTVKDIPDGVPDITPGEHWNFLFDDNPWDRNRDFRERKAEVHFVAGGMTL